MPRRAAIFQVLALCALILFTAPAAHASLVFDAGPSGVDTLAMNRLPAWVQVASASGRVYAGDRGDALAGSPLSQYTFLRVLGGGSSRLKVEVYDELGSAGLRGWGRPQRRGALGGWYELARRFGCDDALAEYGSWRSRGAKPRPLYANAAGGWPGTGPD